MPSPVLPQRLLVPSRRTETWSTPQELTTTVPKEYVHRAAVAEVLLTGWRETDPHTFTVTAQWPRAHSFYSSVSGLHDPMLFVETVRQLGPFLSHAAYGAPLDHKQLWKTLSATISPEALWARAVPASLELRVHCADRVIRSGLLRSGRLEIAALRGGHQVATAIADFSSHSAAVYRRLRGPNSDPARATANALPLAPAVAPALVGRDRAHDVVLTPATSGNRWQLRADVSHPILFDHPNDHAPGMLLLEAARQAVQLVTGPAPAIPLDIQSVFLRYAELDTPCWIEATPLPRDALGRERTRVTAEQNDAVIFECTVTSMTVSCPD